MSKNWLPKTERPILIAGPCSAETEEQVLETSQRLHKTGKVDILRAGIWKPRTRPIHRGFSNAGEKIFRNRPQWQIPIDFKQERPDLPMINDPSHICGRRDLLASVSQKAMDLNFDGLMIESHITPDDAWSDAKQQITPEIYADIINNLVLRDYDPENNPQRTELEKLRKQINLIDDELISMLSSRMNVAREIGNYKKENNITILQSARWNQILDKYKQKAQSNQLSEEFITRFIKAELTYNCLILYLYLLKLTLFQKFLDYLTKMSTLV